MFSLKTKDFPASAPELEALLNENLRKATRLSGDLFRVRKLEAVAGEALEISVAKSELEQAVREIARTEANKHGVTLEEVRLDFTQIDARTAQLEIKLRGKKMFLSASNRIEGKLEIDEHLHARLSGLRCTGEGAMGAMACGFLQPQLDKLSGPSFPLGDLSLGGARPREVSLQIGDRLALTALC